MNNTFSVQKARKILGSSSKDYTDKEIELLINQFYALAEIITSIVGSKQTTKGIEPTQ